MTEKIKKATQLLVECQAAFIDLQRLYAAELRETHDEAYRQGREDGFNEGVIAERKRFERDNLIK